MTLEVTIIGITRFSDENAEASTEWKWSKGVGVHDGEALTEFAGRACYQSWSKPNPQTRENDDYLAHIEEVGHWSVMEHATVTFYIRGVSRSLTHELIRHRHLSPSQLSQRFVVLNPDVMERTTDDFVVPPLFEGDTVAAAILLDVWENAVEAYEQLIERGKHLDKKRDPASTSGKKRSREAARCVLPNMTPTAIVLTGNHRAWREMLLKRLQPEADAEISRLASVLFELLCAAEPALYQDLEVVQGSLRKMSQTMDEPEHDVEWDRRLDAPAAIDEAELAFVEMPSGEERPGHVL